MTFGRNGCHGYIPLSDGKLNADSKVPTEVSFPWREIPRDSVTLGEVLGEGEFGIVVKGELCEDDGRVITCAVKKLKSTLNSSSFLLFSNSVNEQKNLSCKLESAPSKLSLSDLLSATQYSTTLTLLYSYSTHETIIYY